MKSELRFNAEQLRDLRQYGVLPKQVEELLRVLPRCRSDLQGPALAPMTQVREELDALRSALEGAMLAIRRLRQIAPSVPALQEVLARVQMQSIDRFESADTADRALQALEPAIECIEGAIRALPSKQRYHNAPTRPVHLIHKALLLGYGRAMQRGGSADPKSARHLPHVPTARTASPFRVVVGICYDSILDAEGSDPERAIKAFLSWRRRRDRVGRQVTEQTDLPS